jgi:AGZA family xanthine/uracil permease-like MFS transporter
MRYFKIKERKSSLSREIRGGVVTFFTMGYIIVLNPLILGLIKDKDGNYLGGGNEPNLAAIGATTALVAGVLTILMGFIGNFPLALATGLGLNSFLAYSVAPEMSWADAMGIVVLEGIIITLLTLTGFRRAVFRAVPKELKDAISVGIGLFITLIAFVDGGFVKKPSNGPVPLELGNSGRLGGFPIIVFIFGLLLLIILYIKKIKGAFLISISLSTILAIIFEKLFKIGASYISESESNPKGWGLNVPKYPDKIISSPDFTLIGDFNLLGSFEKLPIVMVILLIFTLLLSDFFDTVGTITAIGGKAELIDKNGEVENTDKILFVDSLAALSGGVGSISSNTSYIESASGVSEGARTGLASIVTGILFLLATFLSPLVEIIPYEAATPALVMVGFLMISQIKNINFERYDIGIPAFLTIVLMPFTYNISIGIGTGFISYTIIKLINKESKDIHPLMYIVALLFIIFFSIDPILNFIN